MSWIASLLESDALAPHGFCLLWRPGLIWTHVVSDLLIAGAYLSIPVALTVFLLRRHDLQFSFLFALFALFILACGATHVMDVWTLWQPVYGIQALVSVATAAVLWPILPQALALPSPAQLHQVNRALQAEVRERTEAEARVRHALAERTRSDALLATVFDAAVDSLMVMRLDPDGAPGGDFLFEKANVVAAAQLGLTPELMAGRRLDDLLPPATAAQYRSDLGRCLAAGRPIAFEMGDDMSGSLQIWQGSLVPLSNGPDGAARVFATYRNVTEERARERELQTARVAAEAAAVAKSQFLAVMSHEIRTPLNGVLGYNEMLLESGLTPEQRGWATVVRDAGRTLLTVINDVLDLSRAEAGQLQIATEPLAVGPLVRAAVDLMAVPAAEKGLDLQAALADGLPAWVEGDAQRLRQVLLNLLSNAVKFTDAGRVTLSAAPVATPAGTAIRFAVTDTGIGIPEDKRDRLFQRFSQVDPSVSRRHGGSGLGLAISREIVEAMGGQIGCDSAPGQGSTFWFEVMLPPAVEPPQPAAPAPRLAARPLRILLAEDQPVNQALAAAVLRSAGHRVEIVGDGHGALSAVQRSAFDFVLMDVQMPGMDGLEATRAIRALGDKGRLPIVALTAGALPEEVAACRAAGMDGHIAKPFQAPLLLEQVARLHAAAAARAGAG